MSGSTSERTSLTRRNFLKTTALAGGCATLGMLSGCAQGGEVPEDEKELSKTGEVVEEGEVFFSSCDGNCHGFGCPINVTVVDGKAVRLCRPEVKMPDGSPSPYQRICVKGYTNIERVYSDKRVQYPMKRKGERGAGEWERVSWDDAIADITTQWRSIQKEYGKEALCFLTGSGSVSSQFRSYNSRLRTLTGATELSTAYDITGGFCQMQHNGVNPYTMLACNSYSDIANADNIFVWGSNPSESAMVDYHWISDAQERGAKLIVVDPIYTTTASKSDLFVPVRPGADGLLIAAMAQIIMRDGKTDVEFMREKTVAPFLVKDDALYLRLSDLGQAEAGSEDDKILVYEDGKATPFDEAQAPEIEGFFKVEDFNVKPAFQILSDRFSEWDLDTVVDKTGVPIETIEELAQIYMSGKSMFIFGYGQDHYANGQTFYDAALALADITGQESKHGAGSVCLDGAGNAGQGLAQTATADLADFASGPTVYTTHFHQLVEQGSLGPTSVAPRAVYISFSNLLANTPDRQRWLSTLMKMDLIVVSDFNMSETATYADYVLPAAMPFEHINIAASQSEFVRMTEKALEPAFESKSDFEILSLLTAAMGFGEYVQKEQDYLASLVDNDVARQYGVTFERLKEEHAVWANEDEPIVLGLNVPIPTATGRFEFYHEGLQPMFDAGQEWDMEKESCWFWEPPLEAWREHELYEKYPLVFLSERDKLKTHTMFSEVKTLLEINPEPTVRMSPNDASSRGIQEGDVIRLFNDRGYVVVKAAINAGCPDGAILIDHGWQKGDFIDGHYADLTSSAVWPRFEQSNWFDCLCEMEKVQ